MSSTVDHGALEGYYRVSTPCGVTLPRATIKTSNCPVLCGECQMFCPESPCHLCRSIHGECEACEAARAKKGSLVLFEKYESEEPALSPVDPMLFTCPRCGSSPGMGCRSTLTFAPVGWVHPSRKLRAKADWPTPEDAGNIADLFE